MNSKTAAMTSRKRIDSLQALRTVAFLGIFFVHANFFVNWASLGVSVFYVMSGFLMMYRYEKHEFNTSIKKNLAFSLGKIKKLYPLHIMTMLVTVLLFLVMRILEGLTLKAVLRLIGETILNITLLQTWIPHHDINVSLNGVAWYLSVTVFLYFIFPYLHGYVKKNNLYKLCVISAVILFCEIILCIPFIRMMGIKSPVYVWFMYCFPVFRTGDFFIGCVLEKLYVRIDANKIDRIKASALEILATCITVAVILWIKTEKKNIVLLAANNSTTLYIPLAAIWVCLFALNKGIITGILVNKPFIYIGNISAYAFLIHYVITQYVAAAIAVFQLNIHGLNRAILVAIELVFTILLSVVYKYMDEQNIFRKIFGCLSLPFHRLKRGR